MQYSEPKLINVEMKELKVNAEKKELQIDGKKVAEMKQTTRLQLLVDGLPIGTMDWSGDIQLGSELAHRWFAPIDDPLKQRPTKAGNWVTEAVLKMPDSALSQQVNLQLQLHFWLAAPGLRFCVPSPEASDPCCGTMVEVRPQSVLCSIDNSDSVLEVFFVSDGSSADLFHGEPMQLVGKLKAVDGPGLPVLISVPESRNIGERLALLHEGQLTDATVIETPTDPLRPVRHGLELAGGGRVELDLNHFNHCAQRIGSVAAYEAARVSFCEHLRSTCAIVEDAVTGIRLRVEDQTLQIKPDFSRGVQREGWVDASDVKGLAPLLLERSPDRQRGAHQAPPAIVEALPGTGKVSMCA